ncbi:unnamed protein product [Amaranthus hypochondriacus]
MRNQWRLLQCLHHRIFSPSYFPSTLSSFKCLPKIASLYHFCSSTNNLAPSNYASVLALLFTAKEDPQHSQATRVLTHRVSILKNELVKVNEDFVAARQVLEEMGFPLFCSSFDGFLELLKQLHEFPRLSIEVFNWRRKHTGFSFPITSEEYAKGIQVAGRARNVDLAVELFTEAAKSGVKTSSIYNALMSVYMLNGMPEKCQSLFREFKKEECCTPTIVTYNILISVFGHLMLIDHMEATLQEINNLGLFPTVSTFNNLIAGYVTAWMWDRMENAFLMMSDKSIEPDTHTYRLLLRGYSFSGNLKKMEEIYELQKHNFDKGDIFIFKMMITAYCKNSCENRIEKIDSLIGLIPKHEYKSWLIVLLIKVYAEEQLLERMEAFINVAFEQQTKVYTKHVMRSIITAYYHLNAVDKLTCFVKRAESAGWRICRSLYHCKMVMYSSQNRLQEMENVLAEMENVNLNRTKKTWVILFKAYLNSGPRCKLEQVQGLLCKLGY